MKEFTELESSFRQLMGKDISVSESGETAGSIAYGSVGGTRVPADVEKAAKTVYEWLMKPSSKWRSLVVFLSGGGTSILLLSTGSLIALTSSTARKVMCQRLTM